MTVETPNDLIALAFKDAGVYGVGQTPSSEDANDALDRLNGMLAQWRRRRWLVYRLLTTSKVSTGAQSYTVGTGGDFNITRPDKIESAFVRLVNQAAPNQTDYPLRIIEAREDYNRIVLKQLTAFPYYLFYDSAYPLGSVFPWPVPSATIYSLHITTKDVLPQFASLAEDISLPLEYLDALRYNLAVRLRMGYGMDEKPGLAGLAKDALNVIRMANTQIPQLHMPGVLTRGGNRYNLYSDTP